jgi:hypothetical protein
LFFDVGRYFAEIPIASGLYRPDLEGNNVNMEIPNWGILMNKKR